MKQPTRGKSVNMRFFALVAALISLASCGLGETSYRYRLTFYVQTPDGVKTGGSVIEISSRRQFNPLYDGQCGGQSSEPIQVVVRGQAAQIPLGRGQMIFATLINRNGMGAQWYPAQAYHRSIRLEDELCPGWAAENRRAAIYSRQTQPGVLFDSQARPKNPTDIIPMLLRFGDRNDPRSVQVLNEENLAENFGPGYRLLRVTLEMTDDPVTDGITEVLPWLATRTGPLNPYAAPARVQHPERILGTWALQSPPSD